eukprot:8414187-Pyramimonas_sp.AAC.1
MAAGANSNVAFLPNYCGGLGTPAEVMFTLVAPYILKRCPCLPVNLCGSLPEQLPTPQKTCPPSSCATSW